MIDFSGSTPSRITIRDGIAKKLNIEKDLTIIKHVYPRFGASSAKVIAHIYSKKEDLEKIEDDYLKKKHKKEEDPKKEDDKPAPSAPAPAQDAVEEPKPGDKAEEKSE